MDDPAEFYHAEYREVQEATLQSAGLLAIPGYCCYIWFMYPLTLPHTVFFNSLMRRKEARTSLIAVFLICLFSVPASLAGAADWIYLTTDEKEAQLFYDRETLACSDDIVRVQQKEIYGEKHLMRIRDRLGSIYEDLTETVNLIEINCRDQQSRVESVAQYNSAGALISTHKNQGREWKAIPRNSAVNLLYELCCPSDWVYVSSSEDEEYFLNTERITMNASAVTFWMKGINKKTGRETERDRIIIQCRHNIYALHHHISYEPDGKVAQVSTHRNHRELKKISRSTIIYAFQEIVCADKEPRREVKEYLRKAHESGMPVKEVVR